MSVFRIFRTVRHLTLEQWIFRIVCRGRFKIGQLLPGIYRQFLDRTAASLPLPVIDSPRLVAAAQHVLELQRAVHGMETAQFRRGTFQLLGETVDFGSFDAINYREEIPGQAVPMWRLTFSYLGWLVCLLATGRPEDLALAARAVQILEDQNPLSARETYFDVWRPYSVSHRIINLLCGLSLYRLAGGSPDSENEEIILQHVRFCTGYLLKNLERDLQFNHLLKNLVALSVYKCSIDARCSKLAFLENATMRSIAQQHLPDGGHAERSPMYHALYLHDLLVLQATGQAVDSQIDGARKALGTMIHPDGGVALFNDSWLGESPSARALGVDASLGPILLPVTGYARLAVGGDAVILDCGPCGPDSNPGHAHADFLAVEVSINNERFLVDRGVPTYSPGDLRDQSRSAAHHNGPHLLGREPIEFWKSFRVGHRGYAYPIVDPRFSSLAPQWCAAWQDGYRRHGAIVARWVGLWPGEGLMIIDEWCGQDLGRAALKFLIPSYWRLTKEAHFATERSSVSLELRLGHLQQIGPGEWSPRYNESRPAHSVKVNPQVLKHRARAATYWRWNGSRSVPQEQIEKIGDLLREHCMSGKHRGSKFVA